MNVQQQEPFSYFYYEDYWNLRKRHQEPEKNLTPPPGFQNLAIQPPVYQMFPQNNSPVYYFYSSPQFYHFYGPPVYSPPISPRSDLSYNSPPYSPQK